MSDSRPTVAIGLLGTTLDRGARGVDRWNRWRPTVGLCSQPDLEIRRFHLAHGREWASLARFLASDIRSVSPATEVVLHQVELEDPWDFETVYATLFDWVRTLPLDPDAEDLLVHITTGTHVAQICLYLLVESRILPARLAQTGPGGRPSDDSASPPAAGRVALIDLSLSRYDAIARRFEERRQAATSFLKGGIETRNAAFNTLIDRIELVALSSSAPMLFTGPTGAGKSRLARRVWELQKARRLVKGPIVEVNCATIRGDGAMSALFGHRRGSFTGAVGDRPGLLREADGGVLFLDEIGELGLDEQAMLLRAIEDKRFLPVGSDREVESDFRLLAGTNRDLGAAVAAGRFREDLLARIDLWTFALPGLAARPEDIAPNLAHELELVSRATGRRVTMNREARDRFLQFAETAPWPRNFRDLSAAVVRMTTLAPAGRVDLPTVEDELRRLRAAWAAAEPPRRETPIDLEALVAEPLDQFDAVQLAEVVRVCRASRTLSEAGRALFAVSRSQRTTVNDADRVRKYLARFGLDWERVQG
jgi:transcriptional regulatory protein RtcR